MDWLFCVLRRIDNIQAMLFINARPAYVIEYTTISCFFKIQKSFLKRRKLNWEIPRFKRCLHHRNKSRLGQPFCFPRSRICYLGFSRSEKDIEWYWKSFEKESWRWIVFSLSKKYLSFVKFLCILVWQCIYFLYLTEQGITDSQLVGPYFTAADIALTTLLDRMIF